MFGFRNFDINWVALERWSKYALTHMLTFSFVEIAALFPEKFLRILFLYLYVWRQLMLYFWTRDTLQRVFFLFY
jgi:hypothetical protein